MPKKILYTATVTAVGGREGHVLSDDGVLDVALSVPKSMGGEGGPKTNPEQLFAAGYAACFEGALRLAAKEAGIDLGEKTNITAHVGIGPRDAGGFELDVELDVRLDGVPNAEARKITSVAHDRICPYSHATRGNVQVKISLM